MPQETQSFPRWLFVILSLAGAWGSGIYLGKITVQGAILESLIPAIGFGILALLMGWGAVSNR